MTMDLGILPNHVNVMYLFFFLLIESAHVCVIIDLDYALCWCTPAVLPLDLSSSFMFVIFTCAYSAYIDNISGVVVLYSIVFTIDLSIAMCTMTKLYGKATDINVITLIT